MRIVKSPVERWPGSITLPDYLSYVQEEAWEDVIDGLEGQKFLDLAVKAKSARRFLPVILDVVQEWNLAGLPVKMTEETFPATPKVSAAILLSWLMGEINQMHEEGAAIPLPLTPMLTDGPIASEMEATQPIPAS